MSVTLDTILAAQERISPYVLRTPCLRLPGLDARLGCQVYVKAECMQITGAFKLRGAMSRLLSLPPERLSSGVVAASSGNHGRAVAYGAKLLGTSALIVMPRTAPAVKIEGIRALGAEVVLCDASQRFRTAERLCRERNAAMIPPFNDEEVMAGQGTIGLELAQQCPDLDMLVVPVSGGGLLGGVSAAVKALFPRTLVYGAEPAALPRYSRSLASGRPVTVERRDTAADALLSDTPGELCFPLVREYADGVVPVDDDFTLQGMKLLLLEGKLLAEPSSCIGIGAVLQGRLPVAPDRKVCFLISGGNVGLGQLDLLK